MNTFFEVEMDDDLRTQFDEVLKKVGLDENTAINIFAKATVRYQRIPFELAAFRSHAITGAAKRPLKAARQFFVDGAVNLKERMKKGLAKVGLDVDKIDLSQLNFANIDPNMVLNLTAQILDFMKDGSASGSSDHHDRKDDSRFF